jgi:outer membrane protein assembly factor BamA
MLAINLQIGTTIGNFPPADAFNIGGLDSVRGYGYGKVASGRSYGLASIEYRFPLFQSIGGVLFTDLASDFGSSETVLGEPGVLRDKPGSGFGYGLGLRVNSSFGLIRGDLGISDQGEVRFEVTTGQRF